MKNFWTGKPITVQEQEEAHIALEKMTLYGITYKYFEPEKNQFRYNWSPEFIDHLNIMGEIISKNPKLAKTYEGDGSRQADFNFMLAVISKFLAVK
jgi:hypothetical protein